MLVSSASRLCGLRMGCRCGCACSCGCGPAFGVGDEARAHPGVDLWCWRDRLRPAAVGRPSAEFFLEVDGGPAGFVAALSGDRGEHAVPPGALLRIVCVRVRAPVLHEAELAGADLDGAW